MAVKRFGLLTSGGDAPGMNAAVRAAVRVAAFHGIEVVGVRRGYQGLIERDFVRLGPRGVSNIIQNGGTILLTARSKEFMTAEGRSRAAANLTGEGLDGLVVVGGDGSFRGAVELGKIWDGQIVGAPGTIDNDLYGTDYTIGFDTAVNTATEAIDKIRDTAEAHERTFLIEVMGRHAGFIALAVGTGGGAEEILIPETPTELDRLAERLRANWKRGKRSNLIVVAEGDEGGNATEVAAKLQARGIESHVAVLGHLQRGGRPTAADRNLATRMGAACVSALREGRMGVMVGIVNDDVVYTPFQETVDRKKPVNRSLVELAIELAM